VNIFVRGGSNSPSVTATRSIDGAATPVLIRRCVDGSEDAWRDLHQAHYPLVRRFALGMGLSRDELPDFCQEVFLQVFRYLHQFKGDAAFKTWLYRICISQMNRLRRRGRLLKTIQHVLLLNRPDGARPAAAPLSESVLREAQRAIARLKPHLREVFVMHELEGLDGAEVAAILQCPSGTVRRRLHQARAQIEAALAVEEGTDKP
jgi:RNA polymerase sigma-70 factor, ECF subfamily